MHYWKTALLTLVIFGLGGVAGALVTAKIIHGKIERVETTRTGPQQFMGGNTIPQVIGVMERMVKLRPDQILKVRGIMRQAQQETLRARAEWQDKVAALTEENAPEIRRAGEEWRIRSRRIVERSDDAIRELLTAEQKPLFDEFLKKRRSMFQNRMQNGGMPPRPGERPPLGDRPPLDRPQLPPRAQP